MSKTTITINGDECVILPAPKGAFIIRKENVFPCFVPYIAAKASVKDCRGRYKGMETYALIQHGFDLEVCSKDCLLRTEVFEDDLQDIYDEYMELKIGHMRTIVISLYKIFTNIQTQMYSDAISWFKEKFKEHNITKADLDVFI